MGVTELAILRLPPTTHELPNILVENLNTAKLAMEAYSGFPFYYYRCFEDPLLIYIIGAWPSVDFHMHNWITSQQNKDLLQLFEGQLSVDGMFHIDIDPAVTPIPISANVLAVVRHHVKEGQRKEFQAQFDQRRQHLEGFIGQKNVVGGWRLDGLEEGKEEFVLFSGWEAREKHSEFAQTEVFKEYRKISDHVDTADIKHAELLDVSPNK